MATNSGIRNAFVLNSITMVKSSSISVSALSDNSVSISSISADTSSVFLKNRNAVVEHKDHGQRIYQYILLYMSLFNSNAHSR